MGSDIFLSAVLKLSLFFAVQVDCHNKSKKSNNLGKYEDQHLSDKEPGLLRRGPHPRVSDHPHCIAGSQAGEADGETSPEVDEAPAIIPLA